MSNTSSDQSLSLSAAGRNFQLGMVYDAYTDKLFESLNVLNKCPNVGKKSRLCPSQILDLKSSYTIEERMEVFQFNSHMKVGVAFGFLKLGSASGKYVNDMSSSIGQSRMTLQYKQTKRYEELDTATVLKLCDNLELLKMARDRKATHFVAGMTYGNQVLMDFKCTKQRDTKRNLLDIQLKGIFCIGQFLADKFNKDNERIITFDDIQCEIFCESKDIKKPTSFDEAKQIYRDLPTTLENVDVVDCVHLLPLSVIDKYAEKFNKSDINEVVMKKLVHIREDLYEHEMRCDEFGEGNINVSEIKASIQQYTEEMKQSLSNSSPKDWNEEIVKHNNSDFVGIKLRKRIKEESRDKTVRHTCPTCHVEFSDGSEFLTHMGTHQAYEITRLQGGYKITRWLRGYDVTCLRGDVTSYLDVYIYVCTYVCTCGEATTVDVANTRVLYAVCTCIRMTDCTGSGSVKGVNSQYKRFNPRNVKKLCGLSVDDSCDCTRVKKQMFIPIIA